MLPAATMALIDIVRTAAVIALTIAAVPTVTAEAACAVAGVLVQTAPIATGRAGTAVVAVGAAAAIHVVEAFRPAAAPAPVILATIALIPGALVAEAAP